MLHVYVNDTPQPVPAGPATWGELLLILDGCAEREGQLLTMARLDGVDEPSFRDARVTDRPLSDFARIDVNLATPAAFLRASLQDAVTSLRRTGTTARRAGGLFRRADVSPGQPLLVEIATDLQALTRLIALLGGPLGIDLEQITADDVTATTQLTEIDAAVASMVSAQASGDWVVVADALEYDIEPACARFATLLTMVAELLRS